MNGDDQLQQQAALPQGETRRLRRSGRTAGRAVRLRRWLLAGSLVLLALIAGFIGYARYRIHQAKLDLPRLLGIDIKSETNGITLSQSVKGRTLFTIHAAKSIEHKDGKTTLRNVEVTVYGEPGSNRVDRIRGAEFEYDQAAGVVRAMGESEIDLAALATPGVAESKRVHVTANGLVFDQKKGIATADGLIKFDYGAVQGMATGADFDAHTGVLVLRHDVHVTDSSSKDRRQVDAASAELDRQTRLTRLHGATVAQAGETLRAREMVIHLRPQDGSGGGSVENVEGSGGVEVRTADGATATAPALQASVSEQNRAQMAKLTGGVVLHAAQEDGNAGSAVVLFDAAGHASQVHLQQAVHLRQSAAAVHRELSADVVDAGLGTDPAGHTVLRDSVATGHASLRTDVPSTGAKPQQQTTLTANVLHAFGESQGNKWQVRRVTGDGGTRVQQLLGAAEVRTSSGEHLDVTFADGSGAAELASFVQQGKVHVVDSRAATSKNPAGQTTADAERAEYQQGAGTVVLTGSPIVRSEAMQVEAARISVVRATGDAEALGAVKGSGFFAGSGQSASAVEPTHFAADRAMVSRSTGRAVLYGAGTPARLWTASSQVEAPVIDIDREHGTLVAHGVAGQTGGQVVRTVLPANTADRKGGAGVDTIRVISAALRYTQAGTGTLSTAEFTGNVRVDSASGQVSADHATATMQSRTGRNTADAAPRSKAMATGGGLPGGSVEQVVAEGKVRVQQPGRVATGQRLVYTAATGQFVLTGGPPVVRDSVQGTVTGVSLLFRAGDDSVEVSGSASQPARTDIDAPPRQAAKQGRAAKPGSQN